MEKLRRPIVYLVRKRALGDVLWMEPLIRQLSTRYRRIIIYTAYPELFENYPLGNVTFRRALTIFEKLAWKIEALLHCSFFFIDLEGAYERNQRLHFLSAYQQKAGLPLTIEYPRLHLADTEKAFRPVAGKYAVLHLESLTERNYRKVYGVDWARIVKDLRQKGFEVIQIGKNPPDIPGAALVKTTIRQMIAVISNASFFVGIDSGPSHIAASLGVPSLIFFGAVNPLYRHFPSLFKGHFLQQPCEYAGCYHEGAPGAEPSCRLVGDEGIPKCSLHSTEYVLKNIDLLAKEYEL